MDKYTIILGSNSPRRKELLGGLDYDFVVDTANDFEEFKDPLIPARSVPAIMSRGKSHGFHRPLEDGEILVTADTVVVVDDLLLGKPSSPQDARHMLESLSGRAHEVITAVTIRDRHREETVEDVTIVHFKRFSGAEIDYYLDKYKPYDKAGAYGIQEWIGYIGVSSIEGSYFNVMGFPVHKVYALLESFTKRR